MLCKLLSQIFNWILCFMDMMCNEHNMSVMYEYLVIFVLGSFFLPEANWVKHSCVHDVKSSCSILGLPPCCTKDGI